MTIRITAVVALVLLLVSVCGGQDVLYYKFDAGGGKKVINYASRSGIAPAEGTLHHNLTHPNSILWRPGRYGHALAGDPVGASPRNYLRTGWKGGHQGSFTVAFFLKSRAGSGAHFVRTTNKNDGLSIAVSATGGLLTTYWDNPGATVRTTTDVFKLAKNNWVHVALVVDTSTSYFTYYINGKAEIPVKFRAVRLIPSNDGLRIGTFSSSGSFDIDEFRLRLGTASAAEIKRWATVNPAADAPYGNGGAPKGRFVQLDSNSNVKGPPKIGHGGYALEIYGLPGSIYTLTLGWNRLKFGALPLPFDLGLLDPALKGVGFESSADFLWFQGVIGPSGRAVIPAPIPDVPGLDGFSLYSQAVLHSPVLKQWMATNAFVTSIGK